MTAGETINGGTTPVPVYMGSDGEVYACDGNDLSKLAFIGFAVTNGTDANPITVQNHGVVSGFTGLTVGALYYVADDGSVSSTPGTYLILVGRAVSATAIMIDKIRESFYILSVSANLMASADTEKRSSGGTYTKQKEIAIYRYGKINVKFSIKMAGGGTAYGRIYINGAAVGTERSTGSTSYVEYSEDLEVKAGDLVQIYTKNVSDYVDVANFRIYANLTPYISNRVTLD